MKTYVGLVVVLLFVSGVVWARDDKSPATEDEKPLVLSTVVNTWQKKMKRVAAATQQRNNALVEKTKEDLKKTLDDMTGKKVEGNAAVRTVNKIDKDTTGVELLVGSVVVSCRGGNDPILAKLRPGVVVRISGTLQEFKAKMLKISGSGATRRIETTPDTITVKDCSFSKPKKS
jgi:hypothetical protein